MKTNQGNRCSRAREFLTPIYHCIILATFLLSGCSQSGSTSFPNKSISLAANKYYTQGNYEASLGEYEKLLKTKPENTDRVLFEMGIIYSHPRNSRKNYKKALGCFRTIVSDYPQSEYRRDSQMMLMKIQNGTLKDNLIADQQMQIDSYRRKLKDQENEINAMRTRIKKLNQKVFQIRQEPVDKVLIEKQKRQLTLIAEGEPIKTYKIALGGNPYGPKERLGDNKTPEGNYTIESRNRRSAYYLSLGISYPNEKDKRHARDLGVSPGGNIMIHGIKNGLSWVGGLHSEIDWTKGCIAVTNKEMEEIARLVPNGTPVEIRP